MGCSSGKGFKWIGLQRGVAHDMFVLSSKSAVPSTVSSLDYAVMHALEVWPDVKHRFQWCDNSMTEEVSPSNSQANADNDSLRRKLRDSLTSALEMVVSKQLVKSVLGKAVEVEVAKEKQVMQPGCKTEGDLKVDRSTIDSAVKLPDGDVQLHHLYGSKQVVNMHVDGRSEATVDESQGRVLMGSTSEQSGRCDYHPEVVKSPLEDFEKEATVEVVGEVKGGIQLMEKAREIAWNVELDLFSLSGGVNKKYKEKARSLLFNLKDKSNPELRARVFRGEINPEVLVSMSAAELASKELCQWRIAKAEEFASMVVLTEADMDTRRIVKKTHKGEFQVVVEDTGFSAGAESTVVRPAFPANGRDGTEDEGGEPVSLGTGKGGGLMKFLNISKVDDRQVDSQAPSQIHVLSETVEDISMETEEPANDIVNDLPSMTSLDEDIEWQRDSETEEPSQVNSFVQHGEMKTVPSLRSESRGHEMWTNVFPSLSDAGTQKLCESPSTCFPEPEGGNRVYLSNFREGNSTSPVWEGSLQLSATRSVSIGGFYKSGVRLEVTDWPHSVEVKGRVRLGVLEKFLRDLQLSRSRTVTVLSLCPSDGQSKRMGAYLKEIAEHYRMGDRAGFAEPKPGFELYLLAPGTACLDLLSEDQTTIKMALKREDEVLVGVVVWRKSLSQGLSSSRGPEQTSYCLRKVTSSHLLCDSPTTGNVQSLHGKETPCSRAGVSASLKAVSALSLVNVSGNTSMQSIQSFGGSSDARGCQNPNEYEHVPPASVGFHHSLFMVPHNRVPENAHCAMPNACDGEDHPPGFKPSVPEARRIVLTGQTTHHVQDFEGSPSSASRVPSALVPDGNRKVSTKSPPEFWPKSPAESPTGALEKIQTVSQQDDDDLPEFNFDTEEEAHRKPANRIIPAGKTVFLTGRDSAGLLQPASRLQYIRDPTNSYRGHHDIRIHHSPSVEFQSMLNGLPSRRLSQQGESSAYPSVSLSPSNEGWNDGLCARETAHTVTQQNISRSTFSSNVTDHSNLSRVLMEDGATGEMLLDTRHRFTGELGQFNTMPSGFTSAGATISNGASHHVVSNDYFPRNFLPPIRTHLGWPSLSRTLSGCFQHNSEQPALLNMVIEHRQAGMKNDVVSTAGGMPLPYREEARRHEWPAICRNNPSDSSSTNPVYSRSKRKMEPMERTSDRVRASEFYVKDASCISSHSRPRSFCWEPALGSSGEKGQKRWGQKDVCPGRGRSFLSTVQGDTQLNGETHLVKLPKRERERDQ